jgi:hypothetical protein
MLYFDRGKTLGMEKFQIFPIFWDKIRFFPKKKIPIFGKIRLFFLKKFGKKSDLFGKKSDFLLHDRFFFKCLPSGSEP